MPTSPGKKKNLINKWEIVRWFIALRFLIEKIKSNITGLIIGKELSFIS